jgi:glycerophosphoryl diester phosphodiesterase
MLRIAHRGASGYTLENTKKAFKKALYLDTEVIEFDVRQTKDKKIIVIHDDNLERTTNGKGLVNNLTLKKIKKLTHKNGDFILTLTEALKILKNKCVCKIDVKEEGMEERISRAIKRNCMERRVIISTEISSIARKFKEINPSLKVSLGGFQKRMRAEKIIRKAKRARADIISPHCSIVTKKLVREAHKNGFFVDAWGANTEKQIEKMKQLRVDAITTDYPDKV